MDPCVECNNFFRLVSLSLSFANWTNLIKSNVFYNHIFIYCSFIYYRNNYKCNIYNFCCTRIKTTKFFTRIQKVSKRKYSFFFIKVIYNISCIIKKYVEFRNYSFNFKQIFSNPIFSTLQSKTPKTVSQKLIKLSQTTIKNKRKREK